MYNAQYLDDDNYTCTCMYVQHYTDGDFWRREHHGMFLSRGLK